MHDEGVALIIWRKLPKLFVAEAFIILKIYKEQCCEVIVKTAQIFFLSSCNLCIKNKKYNVK